LRVKAERAEELVGEAEAAEKTLSALEDRLALLEAAIAAAGFSEDRYQEARARYEAAEEKLRTAELDLAGTDGEAKVAEVALEQASRRIKERAARVKHARRLRRELTLHDELDKAFHELRLELNATMRPELADRASTFLTELTDGRYTGLELDEHYRILAVEDGLPKPVISGGEEDITNLVLRLAISEMVAERAGQPLSLLVLDEIFGSLDEARRQNVVDLLRRLRDRFPQVVLITHIESVREGVDRVLRVSLDQSRATAVVTENGSD
jgi:exonuclease SbcC